ncbi:hypothetical protein [Histidinibacterium lentulum]|uniref:hypothetical protein n=1 Tax=Histidinibacterium lentulum TaxID=2480588 RepID=UPI001611C8AC|nr:hypothetical protein [Histidinibacterium lentulum]
MPRYIISRGEYVVHNIVIEAGNEDAAVQIAKVASIHDERWRDCGPLGHDVLYQCEGEV